MTLLVSVFAAIITTIIWYRSEDDNMRLGFLVLMYWGASIMWFVDAIYEYIELKENYFRPEAYEMLNDLYLGLSVVALGLIIWLIRLLILDPSGNLRRKLFKK